MSPFSAQSRADTLQRLAETHYDVVVVGGGITGTGVALDAASRGLEVALVEKDDLASGTSSKSSKLVHGGVRYLQSGEFKLVYEALAERQRLLRNAPHIVSQLDFMIPVWGKRSYAKAINTGLWLYDLTGGFRIGKLHKPIRSETVLDEMPTLKGKGLVKGFFYPDAQTDDARLTMTVARTASLYGADVATHVGAESITKNAAGEVTGLDVTDRLEGGAGFTIRTRSIVNAGGVWADEVRSLEEGVDLRTLRPAKGIHLVMPLARFRNRRAVILPVPKDKRSIFVVPWGEVAWVGTTDTDYDGPLDDPQATPEDIDYILDALNTWLQEPVGHEDVVSTWAGLRPLVSGAGSGRTADLSRQHAIIHGAPGMVTVTGGKLTTYRLMAEETVDELIERRGLDAGKSLTRNLPLDGAVGYEPGRPLDGPDRLFGADVERSLERRHGMLARAVSEIVRERPELGRRLVPELPYLRAEVVHAVRSELALTTADLLERRVRLSLEDRSRGLTALDDVVDLMGEDLGWSPERRGEERAAYRARVEATLRAEGVTSVTQ